MNLYRITQIDYIAPQTLRFEFNDGEVVGQKATTSAPTNADDG